MCVRTAYQKGNRPLDERVQYEEKCLFPMNISATKPNTVKALYYTRRGKGT